MSADYMPFLDLYQSLAEANLLPASGASLAIVYLLTLKDAEKDNIKLNKSALTNTIPDKLGSLTRRRYVLEFLIHAGAVSVHLGQKKSEKIVQLTDKTREILESNFA